MKKNLSAFVLDVNWSVVFVNNINPGRQETLDGTSDVASDSSFELGRAEEILEEGMHSPVMRPISVEYGVLAHQFRYGFGIMRNECVPMILKYNLVHVRVG